MKKYETKKETVERSVLVETTCDLCGKIAKRGEWGSSTFEVAETEVEVTVRQKDGHNFPEGGSGTEYVVDMCPECFVKKLIPWLNSQGCKAQRFEWDW